MSLVVCANQEQDGSTIRNNQSVYSAYSFRNTLSSTYKIPKNAQVALQSCKVNVDGRVVFSKNNHRFYHFIGQKLNRDGETAPQIDDVTSSPVIVPIISESEQSGDVLELSLNDFANHMTDRLQATTYHPNFKGKGSVDVLRNASSLDFLGFKISYDQNSSNENVNSIPSNDTFENVFNDLYDDDDTFSYTGGVFQRTNGDRKLPAIAISPDKPLSLNEGVFTVNISGTSGRANASGVPWFVGLSRYNNTNTPAGFYAPTYGLDGTQNPSLHNNLKNSAFADFCVYRGKESDGRLHVAHAIMDDDGILKMRNIDYWDGNDTSYFNGSGGPTDLDGVDYTDVRFTATGEKMKLEIYDAKNKAWRVVTDYSATSDQGTQFKPINQACWCLHPVLGVFRLAGALNSTLQITNFDTPPLADISGYDPKKVESGGWFENLTLQGTSHIQCYELEQRSWNKTAFPDAAPTYTYIGLNGSGAVDYDPVLILDPSDIYTGTPGANARQLLGFNNGIVDTSIETGSLKVFSSDFAPSLTSSMAMFVRLNNFGQNVVNAFSGNQSKILAHLPRFDNSQTTGRLYFEPQNMTFIDLNNPSEMNINEFDISFNYINEQYATVLTGQSIVCLYFRAKPSM